MRLNYSLIVMPYFRYSSAVQRHIPSHTDQSVRLLALADVGGWKRSIHQDVPEDELCFVASSRCAVSDIMALKFTGAGCFISVDICR